MARTAEILVETCSYAGTGNVLKVQKMLQICSERLAKPEKEESAEGEAAEEVAPESEAPATVPTAAAPAATSAPRQMAASGPAPAEGEDAFLPVPPSAPSTPPPRARAVPSAAKVEAAKAKAKDVASKFQTVAVIGIALIAMGEEVGSEMALRHFQHLVS